MSAKMANGGYDRQPAAGPEQTPGARPLSGHRAPRRWMLALALAAAVVVAGLVIRSHHFPSGPASDAGGLTGSLDTTARPSREPAPAAPAPDVADRGVPQPIETAAGKPDAGAQAADSAADIQALSMTIDEVLAEASATVAELTERYPDSAVALSVRAQWQGGSGKTAEAMATWRKCLELDPKYLDAYFGMMDIATWRGDHAEVVSLARAALEVAPQSAEIRNRMADALLEQGKAQEAIEVLEATSPREPALSAIRHYLLGKAYVQRDRLEQAKRHYEAAIGANPDYAPAYHAMAVICARLGEREASRRYLKRFRELKKDIEDAQVRFKLRDDRVAMCEMLTSMHVSAGVAYFRLGDARAAEEHWLRAARLHPGDLASRRSLVSLYQRQGRIEEAVDRLQELTVLEPKRTEYFLKLGALSAAMKRFEAAEAAFQKLCTLAPDRPLGYAMLAKLYVDARRKPREALRLAEKVVGMEAIAPNYHLLCEAYLANGDTANALRAIERAIELAPENRDYRAIDARIRGEP